MESAPGTGRHPRAWIALGAAGAIGFAAPLLVRMQVDRPLGAHEGALLTVLASLAASLIAALMLIRARAVPSLLVAAVLWPLPGLALAAALAGRGWAPPLTAWLITFAPAAGLAVLARGRPAPAGGVLPHGAAASLAVALGAFAGLTLVRLSAGGEGMASLNDFSTLDRAARLAVPVEALRPYRLPADPAVTAEQAGEALLSLAMAGDRGPVRMPLRRPARSYPAPLLPDTAGGPLGIAPAEWHERLIPAAVAGFSDEQRAYLRTVAAHPAVAEFRVTGRAAGADVSGASYQLPVEGVDLFTLPLPAWRGVVQAARVQYAAAALDASEGRTAAAEARLREVISTGILLRDESLQLVPALVGVSLAKQGGTALAALMTATGRADLGGPLAAALSAEPQGTPPPLRAVRAESVFVAQTVGCGSLHAVVYGQDLYARMLLERSRADLTRSPADAALFRLIEELPSTFARKPAVGYSGWERSAVVLLGDGAAQRCPRAPIMQMSGMGS